MSDHDAGASKTWRTPKWVKLLLVASLSANILVGGLVIGQQLRGEKRWEQRPSWVFRILPETRHDEAREIFQSKKDEIGGQIQEMTVIHTQIARVIGTEPLDQDALFSAFAQRRAKASEMSLSVQTQLGVIITRMTPDERKQMAEKMMQGTERWARRRSQLIE